MLNYRCALIAVTFPVVSFSPCHCPLQAPLALHRKHACSSEYCMRFRPPWELFLLLCTIPYPPFFFEVNESCIFVLDQLFLPSIERKPPVRRISAFELQHKLTPDTYHLQAQGDCSQSSAVTSQVRVVHSRLDCLMDCLLHKAAHYWIIYCQ